MVIEVRPRLVGHSDPQQQRRGRELARRGADGQLEAQRGPCGRQQTRQRQLVIEARISIKTEPVDDRARDGVRTRDARRAFDERGGIERGYRRRLAACAGGSLDRQN